MAMEDQIRVVRWITTLLHKTAKLEQKTALLQACGEACAESSALYRGAVAIRSEYPPETDADKLFASFKNRYYNTPRLRKEGNTLVLVFDECTCPLVRNGVHHSDLCYCTTGYTRKIFATLFEQPVQVALTNSILRGDKVCRQVIRLDDTLFPADPHAQV